MDVSYNERNIFLFEDDTTAIIDQTKEDSLNSHFFYAFDTPSGLHPLSTQEADKNLLIYNIYFKLSIQSEYYNQYAHQFDLENKYKNVYKLDPTKPFNEQYKKIASCTNNHFDTINFYTDCQEPKELIIKRLKESQLALENKKQTVTVPRLQKESKIKNRELIAKFLEDQQSYKQGSLF